MGFFPIDEQTLAYLRETGRTDGEVELVERYAKEQQLFRSAGGNGDAAETPQYSKVLRLDLGTIEPAWPVPNGRRTACRWAGEAVVSPGVDRPRPTRRGFGLAAAELAAKTRSPDDGDGAIGHGAVVIAAITSCTNTSNPDVMLAAGLLAKKAVERGCRSAAREDEPRARAAAW